MTRLEAMRFVLEHPEPDRRIRITGLPVSLRISWDRSLFAKDKVYRLLHAGDYTNHSSSFSPLLQLLHL